MRTEFNELLQTSIGSFRLQQPISFDLQLLNAFSEPLIFPFESRQRSITILHLFEPIDGHLRSDFNGAQKPEQQWTDRISPQLSACGGGQDIEGQQETETGAQQNLILTKKSEHGSSVASNGGMHRCLSLVNRDLPEQRNLI